MKSAKPTKSTPKKAPKKRPQTRVTTAAGGHAYSDAVYARALVAFREVGTVVEACRVAGISRDAWYDRLQSDPAYRAAVSSATEDVVDELEGEAIKRAKEGSDTLLIFLLKSRRRGVYGEKLQVDVTATEQWRRESHEFAEIVLSAAESAIKAHAPDKAREILDTMRKLLTDPGT